MSSKGIKTHITITFVVLLAIGMLVTSLVIFSLWRRSMIQQEVEKATAVLFSAVSITRDDNDKTARFSRESLQYLHKALNASCIILSLNNRSTSVPDKCAAEYPELQKRLDNIGETRIAASTLLETRPGLPFLNHKFIITTQPILEYDYRGGIGAVISLQDVDDQISQGRRFAHIYILVNVIILTTIGLFRLIQLVVRPIEDLVALTETYRSDDGAPFFSNKESNEFGQLSLALNKMLRRIDNDKQKLQATVTSLKTVNQQLRATQQQMVQTEKMVAVGRIAAGLAHEIGNPIGIIQGYLELLGQADCSQEEQKQFSDRATQELERINRLIRQLLNFSRPRTGDSGSASVHTLLQELVEMLRSQRKLAGLEFQLHLEAKCDSVTADSESLHQVFLNCLLNSIDAIKDCGEAHHGIISLSTVNATTKAGRACIEITIEDNGAGISATDTDSLFDPFFTTKEPGKGTGLGLSVSYALIESAGGQMQIQGKPGAGATVTILIPLPPPTALAAGD